jgi:hypothetical protein
MKASHESALRQKEKRRRDMRTIGQAQIHGAASEKKLRNVEKSLRKMSTSQLKLRNFCVYQALTQFLTEKSKNFPATDRDSVRRSSQAERIDLLSRGNVDSAIQAHPNFKKSP